MISKQHASSIILISILGFIVYANSIQNKFVWDDYALIQKNYHIKSWNGITSIFNQNLYAGVRDKSSFYRPIQTLTYALDYRLWNLKPYGFHLSNIFFHILMGISLFYLLNLLFSNKKLSLFASLLYISHPIHTEAVTYIAGRAEILAALFLILAFISYIQFRRLSKPYLLILSITGFILALLSKETSMIFLIWILFYELVLYNSGRTGKKPWSMAYGLKYFPPFLLLSAAYIWLRTIILKLPASANLSETTVWMRLPGVFKAITSYSWRLFFPFHLHMEYGSQIFSWTNIQVWLGMGIVVGALVCAIKLRKNKIILFSIVWFFINFMPYSNLYPLNAYMAEHWLYIPSIGFFMIIGWLLQKNSKQFRTLSYSIFILLIAFWSIRTIQQNRYWKDPIPFYQRTLQYAPFSHRLYGNIGYEYSQKGLPDKAIEQYLEALQVNGNYVNGYYSLGYIYAQKGMLQKAIENFKKALKIDKDHVNSLFALARVYVEDGLYNKAVEYYQKALQIDPDDFKTNYNLGNVYVKEKLYDEAIESYNKALEIRPGAGLVYCALGDMYQKRKLYDKSIENFSLALENEGESAEIHVNLGNAYADKGAYSVAILYYRKAIQLNPNYAKAHYNLGRIYACMKLYDKAKREYKEALKIKEDFAEARNNLAFVYYRKGAYTQAVHEYKQAITYNSEYGEAHKNLAVLYYLKKKYKLAIKHYDKAIKLGCKFENDFLNKLKQTTGIENAK